MVSNSENKSQKLLRYIFGKTSFIRKIPDYKTTGMMLGGLPDYLVIDKKKGTKWFEIKQLESDKKSFPHDKFTNQQLMIFRQMMYNKSKIYIILYHGKNFYIVNWNEIYNYMVSNNRKSIPIKEFVRGNIYGKGKI